MNGDTFGTYLLRVVVLHALIVSACSGLPVRCSIEFSVYSPTGDLQPEFNVISARLQPVAGTDGESQVEMLGAGEEPYRLVAQGSSIVFTEYRKHDWLIVTLSDGAGRQVSKAVRRTGCRQYESVFAGEAASQHHEYAAWFERRGRLRGCFLYDDLWVRSSPLYGVPPEPGPRLGSTYEGYLDTGSGEFTIRARHGVRHMIVVGKGKDPLKVFAVNLDAGATDADLGEFDLSDACPPTGE